MAVPHTGNEGVSHRKQDETRFGGPGRAGFNAPYSVPEFLDDQRRILAAIEPGAENLPCTVDRLEGRRTCSECKAVYHVTARPPAKEGICDQCSAELIQRDDDRQEAVRVRMQAYNQATRPLADFYRERNKLVTVWAEGSPDEVFQRTIQSLDSHLRSEVGT